MNPELEAVWNHIVGENSRLKSAGEQPLSSKEINRFIQENTKGKYDLSDITDVSLRNVGRSMVQGATLNWGDEVLGKIPEALGGGAHAEESMRLRDRLFKEANPSAAIGGEMAGMLPAMAVALPERLAAGGAGLLARILRGAVTNAGVGSVAGAGAGEDAASRMSGAETGAVVGGTLGAAAPAVGRVMSELTDPATAGVKAVASAARSTVGGVPALKKRLGEFVAGGRGADVQLGDLSQTLQDAQRYAVQNSRPANTEAAAAAFNRRAARPERFRNDMQDILFPRAAGDATPQPPLPFVGARPGEFGAPGTGELGKLIADRKTWANSDLGFGGLPEIAPNSALPSKLSEEETQRLTLLRSMLSGAKPATPRQVALGVNLSKNEQELALLEAKGGGGGANPAQQIFSDYMSRPAAQDALAKAEKAGINGIPQTPAEVPTVRKLSAVVRTIYSKARVAARTGDTDTSTSLYQLAGGLKQHLAENVPGYSAVMEDYAALSNRADKMELGADWWTNADSRGTQEVISTLRPQELNAVRTGLASEFVAKTRGAGGDAFGNALSKMGAKGPQDTALQDKIKIIFGSEAKFSDFLKRAELESTMAQTDAAAGGSPTHLNDVTTPGGIAHGLLTAASANHMTSSPTMLMSMSQRLLARHGRMLGAQIHAGSMYDQLATRGAPAIDALLDRLTAPAAGATGLVGTAGRVATPAVSGMMGGALAPQQ